MLLKSPQTPSPALEVLIDRHVQADSRALRVDTHKETGEPFQVTLQGQGSNANIRRSGGSKEALHFPELSVNKSYSNGIPRFPLPDTAL